MILGMATKAKTLIGARWTPIIEETRGKIGLWDALFYRVANKVSRFIKFYLQEL
jgi:hypothetical protein